MDPNIQLGLQLLLVGMLSVFFILGIVIFIGKALILLANKFTPTPQKNIRPKRSTSSNRRHIAAITAVVETVTHGRGQIKSIKKL